MKAGRDLLESMLRLLVREWGAGEVQTTLVRICSEKVVSEPSIAKQKKLGNKKRKLLAQEQVERAHLPKEQEAALAKLAIRFDHKQFLPSIADVREFLIMRGEPSISPKDRSASFGKVLRVLVRLSPERLEELANSSRHSGPSRLGPLSDAISNVGATLLRPRDPKDF